MALVYSEVPCVAAGTFTTNIVKAAPVKWDQEIVYNHPTAQAIVCNSGIANACTGEEGYGYCRKTAEAASAALSIPEDSVLVAIDRCLSENRSRSNKIAAGVEMLKPQLAATREAAATAAQAIMTTDTEPKEVAVQIEIGGKTVTIGSMCKGSGMIHPNMCTMLSICGNRCKYFERDAAESTERSRTGHLQHGFRRRRYFHKRYRSPSGKRSCRKPGKLRKKTRITRFSKKHSLKSIKHRRCTSQATARAQPHCSK